MSASVMPGGSSCFPCAAGGLDADLGSSLDDWANTSEAPRTRMPKRARLERCFMGTPWVGESVNGGRAHHEIDRSTRRRVTPWWAKENAVRTDPDHACA